MASKIFTNFRAAYCRCKSIKRSRLTFRVISCVVLINNKLEMVGNVRDVDDHDQLWVTILHMILITKIKKDSNIYSLTFMSHTGIINPLTTAVIY
jgi:hypothetical protein